MSIHRDDELARLAILDLDNSSPGMAHGGLCLECGIGEEIQGDPGICPCDYCSDWRHARELLIELAERLEARRDAELIEGEDRK